jgi:fumarate hydratase class II
MVQEISRVTGHPFQVARNKFATMAAHDAVVATSGALKAAAAALLKIANDLRWLGSGPRCGLGEISLPANEPGSSIMPGKVNPTQCEMLSMVVCQVFGNDAAIGMAGSQGNFELNVYKPLLAYSLLQSITLLAEAVKSFNDRCVVGIEADKNRIREHLNNSLMLATALNSHIGYDKAAEVALKAWRESKSLKDAAVELGYLTAEQFAKWVRPENMLGPGQ